MHFRTCEGLVTTIMNNFWNTLLDEDSSTKYRVNSSNDDSKNFLWNFLFWLGHRDKGSNKVYNHFQLFLQFLWNAVLFRFCATFCLFHAPCLPLEFFSEYLSLFWIGGGNKVINAFMRIYFAKPALKIIVAVQNWCWFCMILPKKNSPRYPDIALYYILGCCWKWVILLLALMHNLN